MYFAKVHRRKSAPVPRRAAPPAQMLDYRTPWHPEMNPAPDLMPSAPAPRPWPRRDWDRMPGRLITAADYDKYVPDFMGRDKIGKEKRKAQFELDHQRHLWARENNPGVPPVQGITLFCGRMGRGKTLLATALAHQAWVRQAIPVFSSMSLLFGYRLTLAEVYASMEILPRGCIVLIDEIAAVSDNQGSNANRTRTLNQSVTAFRKNLAAMWCATANEQGMNPVLKLHTAALVQPRVYTPTKTVRERVKRPGSQLTRFEDVEYSLREHEMPYPPFCYMKADALVDPWQTTGKMDEYYAWKAAGGVAGARGVPNPYHERAFARLYDFEVYWAACQYDTFDAVPITAAHRVDAGDMRMVSERAENRNLTNSMYELVQIAGDRPVRADELLLYLVESGKLDPVGKLTYTALASAAAEMGIRVPARDFQRWCQHNLPGRSTTRSTRAEAIYDFFRREE